VQQTILSIGECMIELSDAGNGLARKSFAGDTFNTAWYLQLCLKGKSPVSYFTTLGQDRVSAQMLEFMQSTGIETQHIRRIPGRMPGLYMIHLDKGERSFSYWRENSAAKCLADDADHLRTAIEASSVIYFSGITMAILSPDARETLLSELRRAKAAGKTVAFDPNLRPRLWEDADTMRRTISDAARASTLVLPGFDDEAVHFGDASHAQTAQRYAALGASTVIVKDGPNGVSVLANGIMHHFQTRKVDRIVDTTSAGDSFNGAFLSKWLHGETLETSVSFANFIAAAVIGHHGALIPADALGLG
jgi:2-dehydro-3-deoxygluconokinase